MTRNVEVPRQRGAAPGSRIGLLALAVFLIALPLPVQAARKPAPPPSPTAEVERLTAEGARLYRAGQYYSALERFRQALDLQDVANIYYNIALCLERLGKDEAAIQAFQAYIDHADANAEARDKARERIVRLRERLAEDAAGGPRPPVGGSGPTSGGGGPQAGPTGPATGATVTVTGSATPGRKRSRVAEWVLIGTGSALVVTGAALYGTAWAAKGDFEDAATYGSKKSRRDLAETTAIAGDVCLSVGLAAVATGVILYLALPDRVAADAPAAGRAAWQPTLAPGYVGVEGRF